MTAPALPGAAPDPAPGRNDPARLPPEVEKARIVLRRKMGECGVDGMIFDTLWSCDVAPILAALGGDGEPVAWGAFLGSSLKGASDDERAIREDYAGYVHYRVVPLYTRPAATGDTGEGEKARAKVVDAAIALRMADAAYVALHTSVKDDDDALQEARGRLDHLHAVRLNKRFDLDAYTTELIAATGGPDAR